MLRRLDELKENAEPATSLYLPAGISLAEAEIFLKQIPAISEASDKITRHISAVATGAVLFWGTTHKLLMVSPFPVQDKYITAGYAIEPLRSLLARDFLVGIVLVRLGYYSIGISRGETLLEHKTGTGLVHGRQRQGGSSSNRYRRRREEQAHHFLTRVTTHAGEILSPYARTLDYLVYGGARTTILQLQKQSDFLAQFENRLLPPLLDISNPHLSVLEKAVTDIWSSKVTEWHDE